MKEVYIPKIDVLEEKVAPGVLGFQLGRLQGEIQIHSFGFNIEAI